MDDELQALTDFLRQHWDTYSLEALRAQLIAQGHDEQLVGTAILRVRAEHEAAVQADENASKGVRRSAIMANVIVVLTVSVLGFYAGLSNLPNPWWLLLFAPLLELALGAVFQRRGQKPAGRALIAVALYSLVPMICYSVLVGLCVQGVQG